MSLTFQNIYPLHSHVSHIEVALNTLTQLQCYICHQAASDEKNLAGLDCCEDNDILRVGDTLTYDVRAILSVNVPADPQNPVNNLYGSKDAYLYTSFVGGKVYYEATIPVTAAGKLSWDTDAISSWMQDIKVSEDGRTLTGYVKLDETQISVLCMFLNH